MTKQILLVDDEINPFATPDTREDRGYMAYYVDALRDKGFRVTESVGVDEAWKTLLGSPTAFDVVVLDIMMPPGNSLDRIETLEGLRSGIFLAQRITRAYPKVPIVVLTNSRDTKIREALGRKASVRAIMFKPTTPPFEFAEKLQEILGN